MFFPLSNIFADETSVTDSENENNSKSNSLVINFDLSISDVIASTLAAVLIAMFILWYQRRIQRDPIKKSIGYYLKEVRAQKIAHTTSLPVSPSPREYLTTMLSKLERLTTVIVTLYGSDEADAFDDRLLIWKQALGQIPQQNNNHVYDNMFDEMILFLDSKLSSF